MEKLITKDQQNIWDIMQHINHCWYKEQPAQLAEYFHNDIVFNSSDIKHHSKGKDICIQSYINFLNSAKILLFSETNPVVNIFDNTAIVTYEFEMKYEQKNKVYHDSGTEIMIFDKYENSWKAIWRILTNVKTV